MTMNINFNIEESDRRKRIAMLSLGLVMAIEDKIIKPADAQKALFRPGIFFRYEDDPEIFRILNLGEELEYIVGHFPEATVKKSIDEIKELCCKILCD